MTDSNDTTSLPGRFHNGDRFEIGGATMTRTGGRWPCICGQTHDDEQVDADLRDGIGRLVQAEAETHERSILSSRVDAAAGAARVARYAEAMYGRAILPNRHTDERVAAVMAVADEEQADLRAEVERLTRLLELREAQSYRNRAEAAEARLDALVADLRGLADKWERVSLTILGAGAGVSMMAHSDAAPRLRAVLDKHAGEQAQGGDGRG
jgi:hypothetical protein